MMVLSFISNTDMATCQYGTCSNMATNFCTRDKLHMCPECDDCVPCATCAKCIGYAEELSDAQQKDIELGKLVYCYDCDRMKIKDFVKSQLDYHLSNIEYDLVLDEDIK